VVWNVWPDVLFVIEICQLSMPGPCSSIETVTESPGATARGTCCDGWGSISIHAWNSACPPPGVASCVPAWIRSRLVTPPMSTYVAPIPLPPATFGCGTVQVPVTLVYGPAVAA
jgi:hypothetical protein